MSRWEGNETVRDEINRFLIYPVLVLHSTINTWPYIATSSYIFGHKVSRQKSPLWSWRGVRAHSPMQQMPNNFQKKASSTLFKAVFGKDWWEMWEILTRIEHKYVENMLRKNYGYSSFTRKSISRGWRKSGTSRKLLIMKRLWVWSFAPSFGHPHSNRSHPTNGLLRTKMKRTCSILFLHVFILRISKAFVFFDNKDVFKKTFFFSFFWRKTWHGAQRMGVGGAQKRWKLSCVWWSACAFLLDLVRIKDFDPISIWILDESQSLHFTCNNKTNIFSYFQKKYPMCEKILWRRLSTGTLVYSHIVWVQDFNPVSIWVLYKSQSFHFPCNKEHQI